jgi:hypothetical protein
MPAKRPLNFMGLGHPQTHVVACKVFGDPRFPAPRDKWGQPEALTDLEQPIARALAEMHVEGCPVRPGARDAFNRTLLTLMAAGQGIPAEALGEAAMLGLADRSGLSIEDAAMAFCSRWCTGPRGSAKTPAQALRIAMDPEVYGDRFTHRMALFAGASDFPLLMADLFQLVVLDRFEGAPPTWPTWGSLREVERWDTIHVAWADPFPALQPVPPGEVFRQVAAITEAGATYQLCQYGNQWSQERRLFSADGDKALRQVERFGLAASVTEDDVVYTLLTSNPVMSDGKQLFTGDHANTLGGVALSATTLAQARAALAAQATAGGVPLNLKGRFLLVPVALSAIASSLLDALGNRDLQEEDRLVLVVEPRIDRADPTSWYLACKPRRYPTLEVAFLTGERQPVMALGSHFDSGALRWRCRHTFGVGLAAWEGIVKG